MKQEDDVYPTTLDGLATFLLSVGFCNSRGKNPSGKQSAQL
jgi:hypothetical protein